MSAVWLLLNREAAAWAAHEARACWQGAACIALVWAVCRLGVRRLPASVRAGLWWLACLRLLIGLLWLAPVSLPVLPASPSAAANWAKISAKAASPRSQPVAGGKPDPLTRAPDKAPKDALSPALPSFEATARPSALLLLQAAWLVCILSSLGLAARSDLSQRRLRRNAVLVQNAAVQDEFRRLADALGIKRLPRLAQSNFLSTPCVSGLRPPTVLLPCGLAETTSQDELRLALAHELAHVKRGDLRLAWIPALARGLFFFHPLVWLACREWATAREESADAVALRLSGAAPACLGRLLLRIASQNTPSPTQPALGLTAGYAAMKRRLVGLTRLPSEAGERKWRRAAACLLVPVLPLSIPWQLTSRERPQPTATPEQSLPLYKITDLGVLEDQDSEAVSLNNAGQVVGNFHATPRGLLAHAFVWRNGQIQPLDGLRRYPYTLANGINNQGQVIASSYNLYDHNRAFVRQEDGAHRLGTLPGYRYSKALGLNDSGQIVGYAQTGDYDSRRALITRAFLWQNGEMTDLGALGGDHSSASGINNSGLVVGKADTTVPGQTHAFLWQNGKMTDLGTLGGANSLAARLNARGQIVGTAETEDARHAALWENGQPRDLGTLDGDTDSQALDINAQGLVVGSSEDVPSQSGPRAVLWQQGRALDLNQQIAGNAGWTLEAARAINDRGQIAGQGLFAGRAHAFLLTPLARK